MWLYPGALTFLYAINFVIALCFANAQESVMEKVNLAQKFLLFTDQYSPKIVGELNDAYVKVVKLQGEFVWHHHDNEDELFFVIKGALRMRVRENGAERELIINPGEFIIIPHGVEHLPSADEETHVMLLEPKTTLNTGNVESERTVHELQKI
jgi:mannose-6-phosphate isomerase-like protein (cupin superfamily)